MTWFDVIKKSEATNALLQIITEDLKTTIPHHIESMSFMNKKLGLPVDYKSIREAFNRTWENSRVLVSMDAEWMRQFAGDGYNMNDVNWSDITKGVMKLYDQIIDNI